MKKIFISLLTVWLVLCLTACEKSENTDRKNELQNPVSTQETSTVLENIEQSSVVTTSNESNKKNSPHKHKYSEEIIKKATCVKKGVKMYICDCGTNYTKKISANGHRWNDWEITSPPTTAAEGRKERSCKSCNKRETKYYDKLPSTPRLEGPVTEEQLKKIKEKVFELVNNERKKTAEPFSRIVYLDKCAQIRSEEIIDRFSNTRPNGFSGSTLIDHNLYDWHTFNEGICRTTTEGTDSVDLAVDTWNGTATQIEAVANHIFTYFNDDSKGYKDMLVSGEVFDIGIGISYLINENYVPVFYVNLIFAASRG